MEQELASNTVCILLPSSILYLFMFLIKIRYGFQRKVIKQYFSLPLWVVFVVNFKFYLLLTQIQTNILLHLTHFNILKHFNTNTIEFYL